MEEANEESNDESAYTRSGYDMNTRSGRAFPGSWARDETGFAGGNGEHRMIRCRPGPRSRIRGLQERGPAWPRTIRRASRMTRGTTHFANRLTPKSVAGTVDELEIRNARGTLLMDCPHRRTNRVELAIVDHLRHAPGAPAKCMEPMNDGITRGNRREDENSIGKRTPRRNRQVFDSGVRSTSKWRGPVTVPAATGIKIGQGCTSPMGTTRSPA